VQIISRQIKNGDIEENEEIRSILDICDIAQEEYVHITPKDLRQMKDKNYSDLSITINSETGNVIDQRSVLLDKREVLGSGIMIIARQGEDSGARENIIFDIDKPWFGVKEANFATKIYSIDSVKNECSKLLKYIVKQELEIYTEKMRQEIDPRPYIYDLRKFFIGGSNILLGKQIDAGTYDTEVPIGGGVGNFPYGDINDCATGDMTHPLSGLELSQNEYEQINELGGFYLEKYLVVYDKIERTARELSEEAIFLPDSHTTTIGEFKAFLNSNRDSYDLNRNISDYFGNATMNSSGDDYFGTIGVKFGVRLCYMPSSKLGDQFLPFTGDTTSISLANKEEARRQRSFILEPAVFSVYDELMTQRGSEFSFPIASYEQDITDNTMGFLIDETNESLNEDMKCYIDKLAKTEDFKHFMDNILNITKYSSGLMMYSYSNLLPSIGQGQGERFENKDDDVIQESRYGWIFNDSRAEVRKLFVSYYKNEDRTPANEEEDNSDMLTEWKKRLLAKLSFFSIPGGLGFGLRRRIKTDNPFDKNGNECKNQFERLFDIKKEN
jgi:hypothetical protein